MAISDLVKDKDYTVAYDDNTAEGTAKVIIESKGNHTGTMNYNGKTYRVINGKVQ